ncbi:MAG: Mut7-C ubiquitin/RNAse domain-containing protein [Ignavibacteria bacterium]|nr:Mut7-C ubiquitin/RNAse domain-containing protein [Ignavibacteria bacterium]MBT8387638.1 Mut7-C ubiquitin/RNAse domain-containing protein [Ignavibacteria bacterium]
MHQIHFRFYEELNDFLPEVKRKVRFTHKYIDRASVKDVIESLGVPHIEVDMILVNGISVSFNYLINSGDDISVYPLFESLDISDVQNLRAMPLRDPKFIADVHLGKLSRYLRMMGFDVLYKTNFDDDEIVKISLEEKRAIFTKDRGILKRNDVTHGYWVRSSKVKEQIVEIIKRFGLKKLIKEFTRCIECNTVLESISKKKILNELPPKVSESQKLFSVCPSCKKLYWKGTHHQRMLSFIKTIKNLEL